MARLVEVKSVLNKLKSQDDWFLLDYTVNPFMGCALNCTYCYIHGSKYGGEDTSVLQMKTNAPGVLYKQLKNRARNGEYGFVGLGSSTDPYPPLEEELELTRELLKIMYRFKFPVHVSTKSALILRDLELLKKIDEKAILPPNLKGKFDHGLVVSFSFSTVDHQLASIFESGASTVEKRLETMKKFSDEGFLVGANLMPVLPFLSDSEEKLDEMIGKVKEYGGEYVLIAGLTLFGDKPSDCKVRYYETLEKYFPDVVPQTRRLMGNSFTPSRKYQRRLWKLSEKLASKYDIRTRIPSA